MAELITVGFFFDKEKKKKEPNVCTYFSGLRGTQNESLTHQHTFGTQTLLLFLSRLFCNNRRGFLTIVK